MSITWAMVATGADWRATLEPPSVVARAGETVRVELCVDNPGDEPVLIRPRWVGVDPGDVAGLRLFEVPARAKVCVHQDLAIASAGGAAERSLAVELTDSTGTGRLLTLQAITGSPNGLRIWTEPAAAHGRLRARTVVHAANQSLRPQVLDVRATAEELGTVPVGRVTVPAGGEVTLPLVVRRRPHASRDQRHAVVRVDARGDGAAAHATFNFVQQGLVPALGRRAVALVVLLGLWAGVLTGGITVTRKLDLTGAAAEQAQQDEDAAEVLARADDPDGGATGGEAAAGGSEGDAPSGDAATDGTGGDGGLPGGVEISGKVEAAGKSAEGVVVRLRPVQITEEDDAAPNGKRTEAPVDGSAAPTAGGPTPPPAKRVVEAAVRFTAAQPTVIRGAGDRSIGKRWSEALVSEPSALGDTRTTATDVDGAWGFADVPTPGVYELLFAAPGFSSKSYVVTTADPDKPVQLDVKLVPGDGSLAGRASGPSGPLGGVEITATDGVVTYHTTTATEGDVGAWSLPVVGTPARYIVTFTRRGYGTETLAVDLATGASETAIGAVMVPGVGSIAGKVHVGGFALGNVTVTATDGAVTRSTTTLTEGAPGTFLLPQLPIPGTYTVTVARTGFVAQSLTVELTGSTDALDIALIPATAMIWGHITTAGTDPPAGVAGVGIDVTDGTNVYKSTTALSPAGVFELGGLPPGTYTVTFSRFEYETASSLITVSAGERRRVDLALAQKAQATVPENASLRGVVYSAANGQPLPGARVTVQTEAPFPTATVGADGSFSFENLPIGIHKVIFEGPTNAQHQAVERTVRLGTATEERLEVTLVPLGSLAGHLTDSSGRAIASAQVTVLTDTGQAILTASALTAANGDYNIQAVLSSGAYKVRFDKPGFAGRTLSFSAVVGDTVRVDAQLTAQPRLHGRLVRPEGSPQTTFAGVANQPLTMQLGSAGPVQTATTDASGNFEFTPLQLEAGTWTLAVEANGYTRKTYSLGLVAGDDVSLELALSPTGAVSGTTYWVDANGDHVPVDGLQVRALNAITGWEPTPAGGQVPVRDTITATVVTGSADWSVTGHVAETAGYEFTATGVATANLPVTVTPGQPTPFQPIELQPVLGSITGSVVTDPAGQHAGHTVTLTAPPSALVLSTQTDANGGFRFDNLRPGDYEVVAPGGGWWIGAAAQPVALPLGSGPPSTAVAPTLTLNKRSSITVSVADSAGGAAINGPTVQLWKDAGTTLVRTVNPTGSTATFDQLDLDTYEVRVSRIGYKTVSEPAIVVAAHGVDVPRTVSLTRWSVLRGTVLGTRANQTAPLEGALVSVTPAGGGTARQTSTAADGTWSLPELDGGSYDVHVTAAGYDAPAAPTPVTVVLGTDAGTPTITLQSQYATFSATVLTDANDTPIDALTVTATGTVDGAAHTERCTTDPAAVDPANGLPECIGPAGSAQPGTFRFAGFDATSVHLRLEATDHHSLELDAVLNAGTQTLPSITLLGSAGAITGVVRWAPATMTGSTQGTVDGATVVLTRVTGNTQVEVARTTTAFGGSYSFSALGKGKYHLAVSATAYSTVNSAQISISGQETKVADDIVLVAANRTVVVTVTSQPGGAPVVGASVSLTGAPRPSAPAVLTDTNGSATFNGVPPFLAGGGYTLAVGAAGHQATTGTTAVEPGTATVTIGRDLNRFATLSGTVGALPSSSEATVRVANGVTLTPLGGTAVQTTANAADGAFGFGSLAPGTYTLSYATVSGFITPSPQTVTLAWGDTLASTGADYTELATVTVQLTGSGAGGRMFSVTPEAEGTIGPYSSGQQLHLLPNVSYTFD
ncbi:MAG: carboxypeptidase regulatory-like domain-containing protein, partial [Acidimicrobiales bacterium]|nr:carboxypeptidase regulatory-like domain-containing protein [Acidimicrobiales bacterium]